MTDLTLSLSLKLFTFLTRASGPTWTDTKRKAPHKPILLAGGAVYSQDQYTPITFLFNLFREWRRKRVCRSDKTAGQNGTEKSAQFW